MEKLHEPHLIVQWFNLLFGPIVERLRLALHYAPTPAGHDVIPDYLVMSLLIVAGFVVFGLMVRSRLSVEHPSRFQIVLEDLVQGLVSMIEGFIGPRGREFLPLIGALGGYILVGDYLGLIPGLMAPTSNINVTVGCAITTWVYYHVHGVKAQGVFRYILHFFGPPGVPLFMRPLMFVIEVISHSARLLSLSLRLFGNIFGEELVVMILGTLIPFLVPVPMMGLGIITGGLQAYIFVLLTIIYLQGAVASEHHDAHDPHPHDAAHVAEAAVPA
jgi:F-type H+-transporting ATPase subunit a